MNAVEYFELATLTLIGVALVIFLVKGRRLFNEIDASIMLRAEELGHESEKEY